MDDRSSSDSPTLTLDPGCAAAIRSREGDAPSRFALHHGASVFRLLDGETLIGRSERSTVVVDSLAVSRIHAKIVISGDRITLHDLGSRNGTYAGGTRVDTSVEIAEGMEVRLGPVSFVLGVLEEKP